MGATPEQITTAVSTAFKQTSIPQIATFRPTNDIETDGEKIIETITSFENQCLDLNITDPTEKKRLLLLRQPVFSDINVNIPDPATGNAYDKIKQKMIKKNLKSLPLEPIRLNHAIQQRKSSNCANEINFN